MARSGDWRSEFAVVMMPSRLQRHHVRGFGVCKATGAGVELVETLCLDLDSLVVTWRYLGEKFRYADELAARLRGVCW